MPVEKLLVANRGEIAIRVARAAGDLDIPTVSVFSSDDHLSLHTQATDYSEGLDGSEVSVLGQETVTRMYRIAAGGNCHLHDLPNI